MRMKMATGTRIARWGQLGLLAVAGIAASTSGAFAVVPAAPPTDAPAAAAPSAAVNGRQQNDPVADAARRAENAKKTAPSNQPVWTNDNIPKTPGAISIVGTVQPAAADSASANSAASAPAKTPAAADKSAKPAASDTEKQAAVKSDLDAAKIELNTVTTDLDILTRKQTLDSASYYGKPDYASDTDGAAQLKDEQDAVDAKKQEVADAQKKVDDLQSQLDAIAPDSGAAASDSSAAPADNSSPTTPVTPPASSGGANTPGAIPLDSSSGTKVGNSDTTPPSN